MGLSPLLGIDISLLMPRFVSAFVAVEVAVVAVAPARDKTDKPSGSSLLYATTLRSSPTVQKISMPSLEILTS